jgi:hypothetical protein
MKDKSQRTSSKTEHKATMMVVTLAVVIVVASFAGSGYVRRGASAENKMEPRGGDVISSQQRRDRLETELITLQETGFEPFEITRPQGAFILGVDNRTGLESIELRLERASGERLVALQTPRRKISWREVVQLAPGHYLLSVAHHPEWTCSVTILPR